MKSAFQLHCYFISVSLLSTSSIFQDFISNDAFILLYSNFRYFSKVTMFNFIEKCLMKLNKVALVMHIVENTNL